MFQQAFRDAAVAGWSAFNARCTPDLIAADVNHFGVPLRSRDGSVGFERLVPRARTGALRRSLSFQHGLGRFPFHSDAAHWLKPPRWVIMWCEESEGERPTELLPWNLLRQTTPDRTPATFLVRNGRRSFFADVGDIARLDGGCMIAQNPNAVALLRCATASSTLRHVFPVVWKPGLVLVIDNHAVLHSRGIAPKTEGPERRILWRAILAGATL